MRLFGIAANMLSMKFCKLVFLISLGYGKGDYKNGAGLLLFFFYILVGIVLATVLAIVAGIFEYYEIHVFKFYKYFGRLSESKIKILTESFPYYNKLKDDEKIIFNKRIHHFLINKKFVSNDVEVTEEMKVLIAATAMQILFGLEPYYLSHFHNIHITLKENIETLSSKSRDVYISWPSFEKGLHSVTDGYNPGLKILATALNLEQQLNKNSVRMFHAKKHKELNRLYKTQAEKYIASGKSKYNDYKQVDRKEYFAVAVEYFFERPEHFYTNEPEMYMALSKLLRQDPLGNFIYKRQ
jgi:Mlc titration factor MtfA (ptsG expression regulator)